MFCRSGCGQRHHNDHNEICRGQKYVAVAAKGAKLVVDVAKRAEVAVAAKTAGLTFDGK